MTFSHDRAEGAIEAGRFTPSSRDRRSGEREEELSRGEGVKTMMRIKRFGLVILGIDDEGEHAHVGLSGPQQRIGKQRRPELRQIRKVAYRRNYAI